MKFGKQILSQQISGWGPYYLDYKFLKKIINSLEKGRITDAALLATGMRPEPQALSGDAMSTDPIDGAALGGAAADAAGQAVDTSETKAAREAAAQILIGTTTDGEGPDELKLHRAAFFFKLERELEKINAFYLQKEAELKERLRTLIDKRRLIFQTRSIGKLSKTSPSFVALYEGFRYFEKDLSKLQQFIEINATGFRKILKKWDKRSKSQTKELYLARQVDVQPCFNREFIAEMSDLAAANLLELENLTDSKWVSQQRSVEETNGILAPSTNGTLTGSGRRLDFAAARQHQQDDALSDLEANLSSAIKSGRTEVAREMIQIVEQNEDRTNVARIVWDALVRASPESIKAALQAGLPNFAFVDDINLRTGLHEAALAGSVALVHAAVSNGVDVSSRDIYGRTALSYAALSGHAEVCQFLLSLPNVDAAAVDLDGFSPLILAVMNGRTSVVNILLEHGVKVDPSENTDLVPLGIACQEGHEDITRLLLKFGAAIIANAEGLTPQALAARAGHPNCLKLLLEAKADPNVVEKGALWTPVFFAAENGHLNCIEPLLRAGARLDHYDEKGRSAAFYAAWNGKIECLLLLLSAASSLPKTSPGQGKSAKSKKAGKAVNANEDIEDLALDGDVDGIPSLSLPPPVIPFRTYGHNYLDKHTLVSISLTNSSVKLYKQGATNRPEQFPTSSLKLVMTSRPDASSSVIPHNINLPLADDHEVFSFQVTDLDKFLIEWELMPTFGSKVIGKAVALPSSFEGMKDRKRFVLPLQDVYLKVVGEVSFELDFVKPFDSVQLEIGGRVETYWKSMLPSSNAPSTAPSNRMTPTAVAATVAGGSALPASGTQQSSPLGGAGPSAAAGTGVMGQTSFVTASSLSGEYLRVSVQVTKDDVPIVLAPDTLPIPGVDVYAGSVTGQQVDALARSTGRQLSINAGQAEHLSMSDWQDLMQTTLTSFKELLQVLPVHVGIDVHALYPSTAEIRQNPSMPKTEVNRFVDAILRTVYDAGTQYRSQSRKILFSSFSPTVCTALNWKQPNYAVFFCSDCGLDREPAAASGQMLPSQRNEIDPRRQSLREAVWFAKSNNLLGIIAPAPLLEAVPDLVPNVKAAGLLLITSGINELSPAAASAAAAAATSGASSLSPSSITSSAAAAVDEPSARPDGHARRHLLVCRS